MTLCPRFVIGCLALVALIPAPVTARAAIDLRYGELRSTEPLTTERVWILDPAEREPHRALWVVERKLAWSGLEAVKKGGRWGVKAAGIEATTQGHSRGDGSWWVTAPHAAHCDASRNFLLGTTDQVERSIKAAAAAWEAALRDRRVALELQLARVSAEDSSDVLRKAEALLGSWAREIDDFWRTKTVERLRLEERKALADAARRAGLCSAKSEIPPLESRMEAPASGAPGFKAPFARAPARRWQGLFSVRMSVDVADQRLSGQFLMDPGAPASVVSPAWLAGQGINSVLLEIPGRTPQTAVWSGGRLGVARWVQVDNAQVGGYPLHFDEFLRTETFFFSPPLAVGVCCDGILGMDFFWSHAIEVSPPVGKDIAKAPVSTQIWPRESYRPADDWRWLEIDRDRESQCRQSDRSVVLAWEFKSAPSASVAEDFICASGLKLSGLRGRWGPGKARFAVSIGTLGRGPFALDLAHGRLWVSPLWLEERERPNTNGLEVAFKLESGERVLRVTGIRPKSEAARLAPEGIKLGLKISEIDGIDPADLDEWEVRRRLAGFFGETVTLKFSVAAKKGESVAKILPLRARVPELVKTPPQSS